MHARTQKRALGGFLYYFLPYFLIQNLNPFNQVASHPVPSILLSLLLCCQHCRCAWNCAWAVVILLLLSPSAEMIATSVSSVCGAENKGFTCTYQARTLLIELHTQSPISFGGQVLLYRLTSNSWQPSCLSLSSTDIIEMSHNSWKYNLF